MSKYGNEPCQIGDEKYRSRLEARRHQALKLAERAGYVRGIQREVPYVLVPGVVIQGRRRPPIRYVADFVYEELRAGLWLRVVEDAKGIRTPAYRIKRHLMAAVLGIEIRET